MRSFNWQHKDWPDFKFEITNRDRYLFRFYERVGHVSGINLTEKELAGVRLRNIGFVFQSFNLFDELKSN